MTSGEIRNEQHYGNLEGRSSYLIAVTTHIVQHLEQIMDLGDGNVEDFFSYFTAVNADENPSSEGAKVKTKLKVHQECEITDIHFFDITRVGPA